MGDLMSPLPSWAPNVHPLVVHFPIATLAAAVLADILSTSTVTRSSLNPSATGLYIVGATAALIANFSGYYASSTEMVPLGALDTLHAHEDWAFQATWLFVFFASIRLLISYVTPPTRIVRYGALVIALYGLWAIAMTTMHGHRLVFEYGVGVASDTKQGRGTSE